MDNATLIRNIGRPRKWNTPEEFMDSVQSYIQYCNDNPIPVEGIYGKDPVNVSFFRPRITTLMGFCAHCDTIPETWYEYGRKTEFSEVVSLARNLFSSNNIALASAGVANMNIVSRIEGLVDKKEVKAETVQTVIFHAPEQVLLNPVVRDLIESEDWDEL